MFKSISIIGNLGKNPEIRHLQGGAIAANFSVAVNEQWKDKEGAEHKRTDWFACTCYQQGERGLVTSLIQPYLKKGQQVFIQGEPTMRKWTDQSGGDRWSFEIKLGPTSSLRMLGGRREEGAPKENGHDETAGSEPGPTTTAPGAGRPHMPYLDDDIPF